MEQDRRTPTSEADLAEVIKDASGPVSIIGGGTRTVKQGTGCLISTAALSGITLYEPGAMTLVAGSGTTVAEIETVLAAENQRLAFEPMDHRVLLGTSGEPTLGGLYATNTSGPRRIQGGAMRDFALGLRMVDGLGNVIQNGGRVMKNVTGYDLVKMMSGTWGALGIVTEVSLKVLPVPETLATLSVAVASPDRGVAALSAALGSPFDVSGAAYQDGDAHVRIEGFEASVAYRSRQLTEKLAAFGEVRVTHDPGLWADIRDVRCFADQGGDVWKISVKPTDGPRVARALGGRVLLDWGGGLVWALVPAGTDVRGAISDIPGHATCVRGLGHGPMFAPQPGGVDALVQGLKARFDPKHILNPDL